MTLTFTLDIFFQMIKLVAVGDGLEPYILPQLILFLHCHSVEFNTQIQFHLANIYKEIDKGIRLFVIMQSLGFIGVHLMLFYMVITGFGFIVWGITLDGMFSLSISREIIGLFMYEEA
ncbi:hypothetical protein ACJX0J_021062 [Zea mays]